MLVSANLHNFYDKTGNCILAYSIIMGRYVHVLMYALGRSWLSPWPEWTGESEHGNLGP